MKHLMPTITHHECMDVFKAMDNDKSGHIDGNEFKEFFCEYDFNNINDLASKVINDLKQVINTYKLDCK